MTIRTTLTSAAVTCTESPGAEASSTQVSGAQITGVQVTALRASAPGGSAGLRAHRPPRRARLLASVAVIAVGFAAACGGSSEDEGEGGGSPDASGAGATSGSGGASAGDGGSGGQASGGSGGQASGGSGGQASGGSGGSGGQATGGGGGAGGSGAGDCAAPSAPGTSALCLDIVPEAVKAETDPALDRKGALVVQVFPIPDPPPGEAGDALALATGIYPPDALEGGEISLDAIPALRFEAAFPQVVYVSAVFLDNPAASLGGQGIAYGTWIGGIDLSNGFGEDLPLRAVPVTLGAGTRAEVPLVALRRLDVRVTRSAAPVGDGEGPLSILVVDQPNLSEEDNPPIRGVGQALCVDTANDVIVSAVVVGSGRLYVTGILDDLGVGGDLPAGALAAFDVTDAGATIPAEVVVAPDAYSTSVSIDLSFPVPLPEDAGPLPPNSCADFLGLGDGGTPDAAAPDAAAPDAG